jgi:ornithine cyclodeaminase/alanine dehydrogenase-like protein (mu-crystallin family)
MNIDIIGSGLVARAHLEALAHLPDVEFGAVGSRDYERPATSRATRERA